MPGKRTIIVSDVHLGSSHFQRESFNSFINSLEPGVRLILNGDTIDLPKLVPQPDDQLILQQLWPSTNKLKTIWIEGNHDDAATMKKQWQIEMHEKYRIDKPFSTLVLHGVCFDTLGNRLRCGVKIFRAFHQLRIKMGTTSIHFAEYAKRWRLLYRLMRDKVRKNAIRHAKAEGVNAVVCGHVHHPEDTVIDGIRYINTGAWTEENNYYLEINEKTMTLRQWKG